jgi:formylglycine-generating enzyme required for sulfatase activity
MALAPVDPDVIPHLRERLLTGTPAQFVIIRDPLAKHDPQLAEHIACLWTLVQDAQNPISRRFQACCALATYTPDDARWPEVAPAAAQHLVGLPAGELVAWHEALKPARKQLLEPLRVVYRNKEAKEQARTYATETLAEYAADDADLLFHLLAEAEAFQFPTIYAKVADHRPRVVELGTKELARQPAADASEDDKEMLGQRQANVGVALLKLGAPERVWYLLKHSQDPRARGNLIHWLSPLGGDPQTIIRRFDDEPDVTIRRALLLALGEFNEAQLPDAARASLIPKLENLFEIDPDPGLHAAAEWLLRRWGQNEAIQGSVEELRAREPELRARPAADQRQWYVNSQGQTFVILEADEFLMGSPISQTDRGNDEAQHRRRIGRGLAIAAKEVTRAEYQRFLDDTGNQDVAPYNIDQFSRSDDSPQVTPDWYDSARYCNWLSKTEGIPEDQWCYVPKNAGKFAEGMRPADGILKRTGYRLPTEAEREFACRAGAETSRYYGASLVLLEKYAWFLEDSPGTFARPTGLLKPNDFGLFDAMGNALEWCHDRYLSKYPVPDDGDTPDDDGDKTAVDEKSSRVLRGASFGNRSSLVRSAYRDYARPGFHSSSFGFRPARTYR